MSAQPLIQLWTRLQAEALEESAANNDARRAARKRRQSGYVSTTREIADACQIAFAAGIDHDTLDKAQDLMTRLINWRTYPNDTPAKSHERSLQLDEILLGWTTVHERLRRAAKIGDQADTWSGQRAKLEDQFPDPPARIKHLAHGCADERVWEQFRGSYRAWQEAKDAAAQILSTTVAMIRGESPELDQYAAVAQAQQDHVYRLALNDAESHRHTHAVFSFAPAELHRLIVAHRPDLLDDFGLAPRAEESYTPMERAERCNRIYGKLQAVEIPAKPPPSRLAIDLPKWQLTLDGETFDVKSEQAMRWIKVLIGHPGEWLASGSLEAKDPELAGCRTDKLRKHLPSPVNKLIESKPGAGSRYRP